jgi:hypothetical protein
MTRSALFGAAALALTVTALGGCVTANDNSTAACRGPHPVLPGILPDVRCAGGVPPRDRIAELIGKEMNCRARPRTELEREAELIRMETDRKRLEIVTFGDGAGTHAEALATYRLFRAACRDNGGA